MTRFKGTPLFGQDSSPHHTSTVLGGAGTLLFWIIFSIVMACIKPQEQKPAYKEVQIVLASTPVEQPDTEENEIIEAAQEPQQMAEVPQNDAAQTLPSPQESASKVEEAPSAVKTPSPSSEKKQTSESKPVSKPKQSEKPKEPVKTYDDPMEAFNKQIASTNKKTFDWSQFDDASSTEDNSQPQSQSQNGPEDIPLFSGTAGKSASSESNKIESKENTEDKKGTSSSAETKNALNQIASTKTYTKTAGNGVKSVSEVTTSKSADGKVLIQMANGKSRALLDPLVPAIELSPEAAKTIDSDKKFEISFTVASDGNVIPGSINIPSALISSIALNEIKNQIAEWVFEPANYTSQAKFTYQIIKK